MKRENPRLSALALLTAAFDGMPVRGRHELRLSPQEVEELKNLFPAAAFHPTDPTPDGKCWYWVEL